MLILMQNHLPLEDAVLISIDKDTTALLIGFATNVLGVFAIASRYWFQCQALLETC